MFFLTLVVDVCFGNYFNKIPILGQWIVSAAKQRTCPYVEGSKITYGDYSLKILDSSVNCTKYAFVSLDFSFKNSIF